MPRTMPDMYKVYVRAKNNIIIIRITKESQ